MEKKPIINISLLRYDTTTGNENIQEYSENGNTFTIRIIEIPESIQ